MTRTSASPSAEWCPRQGSTQTVPGCGQRISLECGLDPRPSRRFGRADGRLTVRPHDAGAKSGLQASSSAPPLPTCAEGAGGPYDLRKRILAILVDSHYFSTSHGLWTDWKMILQDQQV